MGLEQFFFTWAEKGLDGLGRFQVVAASPRLHRPSSIKSLGLELCRYEVPNRGIEPPTAPVSTGWLTRGGMRFAFTRTYLGRDAVGRTGNFAAHVVVGPQDEMPLDALCCSLDSAAAPQEESGSTGSRLTWWRGDSRQIPESRTLPTPDLPETARPTNDGDPCAEVVAELLARAGQKITLAYPPDVVLRALTLAATALPGLMDTWSVSTYEGPRLAPMFDVVAAEDPNRTLRGFHPRRPGGLSSQELIAGRFAASADPVTARAAQAAWHSSRRRRSPAQAFTRLAVTHRAANEGEAVTADDLDFALSECESATSLLESPISREVVTTEFARDPHGKVGDALLNVMGDLPSDLRHVVGESLGQALRTSPAPQLERAVARVASVSAGLVSDLADALLSQGQDQTAPIAAWPLELVVSALADLEVDPRARDQLLDRASASVASAAGSRLDDADFAEAFARAIERGTFPARSAADLLLRSPHRAGAALDRLGPIGATHVLGALTPTDALELLRSSRVRLSGATAERIVREGLAAMEPVKAASTVSTLAHQIRLTGSTSWPEHMHDLFGRQCRLELNDTGRRHDLPGMARFARSMDDETTAWVDLLAALERLPRPAWVVPGLEEFRRLFAGTDLGEAACYALDSVVTHARPSDALRLIPEIERVGGVSSTVAAHAVLGGALRGLVAYRSADAAITGLLAVASMHDEGILKVRSALLRLGRDDPVMDRALHLATIVRGDLKGQFIADQTWRRAGREGCRWLQQIGIRSDW